MTDPHEPERPAPSADAAPGEGTTTPAGELHELQAALADAEARATQSKDLYMRALAEIENVRRRAARDVEQAHKFALERFVNELVGVKDSLEAGAISEGTADALREGSQATLKLLAKAFEQAGVVEIEPLGEVFNPELHEAMATQPSAEHVPDTVLHIIQKGYQLNGRLLRPARVIVARAL